MFNVTRAVTNNTLFSLLVNLPIICSVNLLLKQYWRNDNYNFHESDSQVKTQRYAIYCHERLQKTANIHIRETGTSNKKDKQRINRFTLIV